MPIQKSAFKGIGIIYFVIILGFAVHLAQLTIRTLPKIQGFIKAKGQYGLLRNQYQGALSSWEANFVIPQEAEIAIVPSDWTLKRIMARYTLYPRVISEDWSYLLDLNRSVENPHETWQRMDFASGATVYAKEGLGFVKNQLMFPSFLKAVGVVGLTSVFHIVIGWLMCSLLRVEIKSGGLFCYLGLSYLVGFLIANAVVWLVLLFGFHLSLPLILGLWISLCGVLLVLAGKGAMLQVKEYFREAESARFRLVDLAFFSVIGYLFVSIAVVPVIDWDSMLHWMMQAKVMFHERTFGILYPNLSYYPILWPISMTNQYFLFGAAYDGLASLNMGVFFVVFVSQFRGALKILEIKKEFLWLPFMLFITYFFHETFFYYKIAEPLYLCFMLAAVCASLLWLKSVPVDGFDFGIPRLGPSARCGSSQSRHPEIVRPVPMWGVLVLILTIGLGLVKLEGFVAALIIGFALFVSGCGRIRSKGRWFLFLGFFIPLVLIIGWRVWVNSKGFFIPISHFENALDLSKLSYFFSLLLRQFSLIKLGHVGLISILLISYVVGQRKASPLTSFLGILFCVYALFSVLSVLGVYTDRLEGQLIWATPRVFFHVAPVLILWWAAFTLERR